MGLKLFFCLCTQSPYSFGSVFFIHHNIRLALSHSTFILSQLEHFIFIITLCTCFLFSSTFYLHLLLVIRQFRCFARHVGYYLMLCCLTVFLPSTHENCNAWTAWSVFCNEKKRMKKTNTFEKKNLCFQNSQEKTWDKMFKKKQQRRTILAVSISF